MNDSTIVAIATAPGRGGIGIVRLSGPDAVSIATKMLQLRNELEHTRARRAVLINGEDQRIDDAVVTLFAAPNSYTGEDVVEIALHGAPVVLDWAVQRAVELGATPAQPGEFTQRAFLNGRIDLAQAEAIRDLIDAQTIEQAQVAAEQAAGSLAAAVKPAKTKLIELIAALEAGIDFAEDDIDVMPADEIATRLHEARAPMEKLLASFEHGRVLRAGVKLTVVGRPNAGKSSLFNRLVERERSIVTPIAGTTRDLVSERVSLDGIPVELIDTAGIRAATDEVERIGVERSEQAMADADVVLLVVDATAGEGETERAVREATHGRPLVVAQNKSDLVPNTGEGIATSAVTGEGIAALRDALLLAAGARAEYAHGSVLTNLRQRDAVQRSLDGLARAEEAVRNSTPHEMVLLDVYEGLRGMDELTGETRADDVLALIFSSFCIGK